MKKIRVLIADEDPAFRQRLSCTLDKEEDIDIVAQPLDVQGTVKLCAELIPDVAIIGMHGLKGIEATRQIKQACHLTSVLMLTHCDYDSYLIGSLRAGAAGFMLKTAPIGSLVSAVRLVGTGGAVFDSSRTHTILDRLARSDGSCIPQLHLRELQILKAAARGLSDEDIRKEFGISQRTVKTHIFHIFRKLHVHSRAEAVLLALGQGWFPTEGSPVTVFKKRSSSALREQSIMKERRVRPKERRGSVSKNKVRPVQELKLARLNRGLSQAQLAVLLGVSGAALSRWEHGNRNPKAVHLQHILRWLQQVAPNQTGQNRVREPVHLSG